LVGVAVNVVALPEQTVEDEVEMLTAGVTIGLMVIVTPDDVTLVGEAQVAVLVS
jgi:hypothetical protein